jgi:heme A synthase
LRIRRQAVSGSPKQCESFVPLAVELEDVFRRWFLFGEEVGGELHDFIGLFHLHCSLLFSHSILRGERVEVWRRLSLRSSARDFEGVFGAAFG